MEARNCKVDESSLTGESVPVEKLVNYKENKEDSYPKNKLYKGTVITEGHAEAIITGVGDNTEIGKTARTASEITGVETPLNKQLNKLAGLINKIAFGAAAILILGTHSTILSILRGSPFCFCSAAPYGRICFLTALRLRPFRLYRRRPYRVWLCGPRRPFLRCNR